MLHGESNTSQASPRMTIQRMCQPQEAVQYCVIWARCIVPRLPRESTLTHGTLEALHGESSKRLATPRNTKQQETPTNNPIGPTDKPHRPNTKHYRKDSLGDA